MLQDLRYLAGLVTEAGVPIREIRMRSRGQILWKDAHQIAVVAPGRIVPLAFPRRC